MLLETGSPKAGEPLKPGLLQVLKQEDYSNVEADVGCCCQKTNVFLIAILLEQATLSGTNFFWGNKHRWSRTAQCCDAEEILKWHCGTLFSHQLHMTRLLVQHVTLIFLCHNHRPQLVSFWLVHYQQDGNFAMGS